VISKYDIMQNMDGTKQEYGMAVDKPMASSEQLDLCLLGTRFEARQQKAMSLVALAGCYNNFHPWLSHCPAIT
jgi:hypothetical protein